MTGLRRWAARAVVASFAAAVVVAFLFTFFIPLPHRLAHPPGRHGCTDFRRDAPLREGDSEHTGLGIVLRCRETGSAVYLFDLRAPRYFLMLTTTTGAFAVRLELLNLNAGRQYVSTLTEIDPAVAPGLTKAERDTVAADIAVRGGLTG